MKTDTVKQTIHFYPSKERRALNGQGNDGFYLVKRKNSWRDSEGKQISYSLGFGRDGYKTESTIPEEQYKSLLKMVKNNWKTRNEENEPLTPL